MLRPTVSRLVCLGIKHQIVILSDSSLMWSALSDERMGLTFTIADVASAVSLVSESRETRDHILLSQIGDFPFRRLLRLAGLRWRYPTPPPLTSLYSRLNMRHRSQQLILSHPSVAVV
jgi:hypothetical protein